MVKIFPRLRLVIFDQPSHWEKHREKRNR